MTTHTFDDIISQKICEAYYGNLFATLTPMLTLFFCIAVGFIAVKTKILPESASKTMAKMETWIFCPALSFMTMLRYCTVDSLSTHGTNIVMASIAVVISMAIAIPLAFGTPFGV